MKIIAIIVTYKGMKWYKNCFESLRNSSIRVETVVIDNQSEDGTIEFIKENYPEIHLIESVTNLGFGKANNIGIKYAREQNADYVFLLNQDAWVYPNTLESLVNKAQKNPEYGIISPIHLMGNEIDLDVGFRYYIQSEACPNLIADFIINRAPIQDIYPAKFVNAALWLISKDCLSTLGGFEPIFPHYAEDYNYIHRAIYHGVKLGIDPNSFGVHDRNFKDATKGTFNTKRKRARLSLISETMDITLSFPSCFHKSLIRCISYSFSDFTHLRFTDTASKLVAALSFIRMYWTIKKRRKVTMTKGSHFI